MTNDTSFTTLKLEQLLWVRFLTRGSFLNSSHLKTEVEQYLASGGHSVVIDLELCQGVDSTFMGTLIGLSNQCDAANGKLQIASPTVRTRSAMESLGLDMIIDIDPPDEEWQSQITAIRQAIENQDSPEYGTKSRDFTEIERTHHVLAAHRALTALNDQNKETFGYVCETLEDELEQRAEQANATEQKAAD